ncbi:MAG TPA: lipocalin-like domain-containing protein [Candidatus Deferrimicrobiaceae bacterium]|nr:lipocalin-like domain-containing protein [Candidatus Deferrimicrobiaceae bacterium]
MPRRSLLIRTSLFAAALLASAGILRCAPAPPPEPSSPPASVTALLGGDDPAGYARAQNPRDFRFPEDHGAHPTFRHEWWYVTGNLRAPGGRRFGYQLTFFRFALSPAPPDRKSRWASNQAFMAHFAVTDVEGRRFHYFERTARGALDLAGATARPFRVWLDDWSAEGGMATTLPIRLLAQEEKVSVDLLLLDSTRPIILQGNRGLSRKGASPGNASYYYSMPRLSTRGTVRIEEESFPVEGNSWLDREWGTSSLEKGQIGWDWFALQLSDGRDLMFYRLRREDGGTDRFSAGTLVLPDGSSRPLSSGDVRIETLASWKSPESGARYPSRWRLRVPSENLDLEVVPLLADQELRTTVRYWEGAASVRGTSRGAFIEGEGYVELTGYGER